MHMYTYFLQVQSSQAHTHEYVTCPTEACDIPKEFIGLFTMHCKHDIYYNKFKGYLVIIGTGTLGF